MASGAFWGGLFLALVSVYLLKSALKAKKLAKECFEWPHVMGKITYSEVVRYKATNSRRDFLAHYEYAVDGKEYKGNRVALFTILYEEEANRFAEQFKQGSSVKVYFKPDEPAEALLVRGAREGKENGEVIMAMFVLTVATVVMVFGYLGYLGP